MTAMLSLLRKGRQLPVTSSIPQRTMLQHHLEASSPTNSGIWHLTPENPSFCSFTSACWGTLAELLCGAPERSVPLRCWLFPSVVSMCHTQQTQTPGTFRVDICAWDGKKLSDLETVIFLGFSYSIPADPEHAEQSLFLSSHLPLAPSCELSVSTYPSCPFMPGSAQISGLPWESSPELWPPKVTDWSH